MHRLGPLGKLRLCASWSLLAYARHPDLRKAQFTGGIFWKQTHLWLARAAVVDSGGEPVGKRLGFLLQELLREANTTGSKGNDAVLVLDVLLIKEELERIREQVENLE